jgi:hypothetical protein
MRSSCRSLAKAVKKCGAHVRCAVGACAPPSPIISTLETDCSGASLAASVRGVAEHTAAKRERVESGEHASARRRGRLTGLNFGS